MTGKPKIAPQTRKRILALYRRGESIPAIAAIVAASRNTVRRIVDPAYAERERERHRRAGPDRYQARKEDPAYIAYQAEWNSRPERLERARENMARLRRERAEQA